MNKLKNSVSRRCPNCKYYLENFKREYIAVGCPLVECSKCSRVVAFGHITEWELLDSQERASCIVVHMYTCFLWSACFAALLCGIPLIINHFKEIPIFSNEVFRIIVTTSCIISASIFFGIRSCYFLRVIAESKMRMTDLGYLKLLKEHGFLEIGNRQRRRILFRTLYKKKNRGE